MLRPPATCPPSQAQARRAGCKARADSMRPTPIGTSMAVNGSSGQKVDRIFFHYSITITVKKLTLWKILN